TKAREKLGWKPTVTFAELVAMMVENDLVEQKALAGLRT
ncbi:MAG: GDP-mannose 4,6-dehydratase, partial [Actinomycetota bacterium]|nr:GDP-mannose 4,6-dehydratase [Actinomycetota bacterium]